MTSKKYYAISDIHGDLENFEQLLKHWNTDEHLVLIGDYIDNGLYSYEVLNLVMQLKHYYKDEVTVLLGNHEEMYMQFCEALQREALNNKNLGTNPDLLGLKDAYTKWLANDSENTIYSFIKHSSKPKLANTLGKRSIPEKTMVSEYKEDSFVYNENTDFQKDPLYKQYKEMVNEFSRYFKFLWSNGKSFLETPNIIFVHAGIPMDSMTLSDYNWKFDTHNLKWTREGMYYKPNFTHKTIIFGHTPTYLIRNNAIHNTTFVDVHKDVNNMSKSWFHENGYLYVDKSNGYIGIDTGNYKSGYMCGIKITEDTTKNKHKNKRNTFNSTVFLDKVIYVNYHTNCLSNMLTTNTTQIKTLQ